MALVTIPRQFITDINGTPRVGAKWYFYQAGTSTLITVYTDPDFTVAHANPVRSTASGLFPVVYIDSAVYETYKVVMTDADDVELFSDDDVPSSVLLQETVGQTLWPRTAAEIAAAVTPSDYAYAPGDVRRYGAALDGTTDDTAALTRWASVGGDLTYPVPAVAKITADIPLASNSTLTGVRGATVQTATPNISFFTTSANTRVTVRGFKFKQTSAGNNAYTAGVKLLNSSNCRVEDCEFEGMQWSAVHLDGSDDCDILNNYVHDSLTSTAGDKFDIVLYRSHRNNIEGNRLFGAQNGGVLIQDPLGSGSDVPSRNKVRFNRVSAMKVYGIVVYLGGSDPTYNEVIGNHVEDVEGDPAVQAATGTGIYCVGSGLGGTKVCQNTVRNACVETTSATNGPGGITIADVPLNAAQVIVSDNTVEAMTQGDGILIVSSPGGARVTGNVVIMPSSNDGSGPGGPSLMGIGVRVWNSHDTAVVGNRVYNAGDGDGILVYATDSSYDRNSVIGNTVRAAVGSPIRVDRTSTHTHTDLTITGNIVRSDDAGPAITLAGSDRVAIVGNSGTANTGAALAFSATTGARVSCNSINANGTNGVTTSGTCTGSNYDSSNKIPGNVSNGGTGFRIEQIGATPAAGTYVAGDTVWHTAPAAGTSPGAICTTGGSPGTWKAMANIAA